MFCQNCGKPSDTPVCPECAAAAQAEAVADTAPNAVPAQAEMPAEMPVIQPIAEPVAQPVIDLAPSEQPPQKKKSKKKGWIALVAVLCAIAVPVALFWSTIYGWVRYQITPAEDYLQAVETEALSPYTSTISKLYGMLLKGGKAQYNTTTTALELQLDPSLAAALASLLKTQSGVDIDAGKLQKFVLDTQLTATDDLVYGSVGLQDALDVRAYLDLKDSKVYLQIPALNEETLCLDTKTMFNLDLTANSLSDLYNKLVMGGNITAENSALGLVQNALSDQNFLSALPSEEEFDDMLNRLLDAAMSGLASGAEKDTETVTVNGVSQSQYVLTTTINETSLKAAAQAVLTAVKDDAAVKKILDAVSAYLASSTGQQMDLYSMFTLALPQLSVGLNQPMGMEGAVSMKTYVNVKGEVLGHRFTVLGMGDSAGEISYNMVEDGDTSYFQVVIPSLPVISGTVKTDGDQTTTTVDLPLGEMGTLPVTIIETPTKFTLRITPPAAMLSGLVNELNVPAALLSSLSLEMALEYPDETQGNFSISLLSSSTPYISLAMKSQTTNQTITLPANAVDAGDSMAMMLWASQLDYNKLLGILADLGMPQNLIDQLGSGLMGDMADAMF